MTGLAQKKCVACEGDAAPIDRVEAEALLKQLNDWSLSDDAKSLSKKFTFKDFSSALAFVNKVGAIAESEGHHPDLELGWGRVRISLTTHAIRGLSENDFILASKVDTIC